MDVRLVDTKAAGMVYPMAEMTVEMSVVARVEVLVKLLADSWAA